MNSTVWTKQTWAVRHGVGGAAAVHAFCVTTRLCHFEKLMVAIKRDVKLTTLM